MAIGQSKLTDLSIYHEKILKLASLNKDSIEIKDFHSSCELKNPMCGDQVNVKIFVKENIIKNISAKVRGCALCEASAGLVVQVFKNKKTPIYNFLSDFQYWLNNDKIKLNSNVPKELEIFSPIQSIKNRHTCIIMPFQAIIKSLEELKLLK